MKTSIEKIAAFISAAIWADGVYDEAEKIAVEEIADALELDEAAFKAAVDAAIEEVEGMDEEGMNAYLHSAADAIDDEEIGMVFEATLQILITDNKLSFDEVSNMLAIAEALGIEEEMAILMLADLVKEEPELEISFDEE